MSVRDRAGRWHYRFQVQGREFAGSTGLPAIRRNLNAARTIEAQKRLDAEQGIEPEEVSGVPFPVAAAEFLTWCHSTCYRSKEMNPLKAYLAYYNVLEYYFEEAPALLPKLPGLSLNS